MKLGLLSSYVNKMIHNFGRWL